MYNHLMEDCTRDNYLQYLYYVLLLCPNDDSDSIEFFLFIFFNSRLENVYRKTILLSSSRIFVGKKKKEREKKKTLHCRVNTTVQKICTCKLQ